MAVLVELDEVRLAAGAAPFNLSVYAGSCTAILGPAASGKSLLAALISGQANSSGGRVALSCEVAIASPVRGLRKRVESLARRGHGAAQKFTDVLSALGLWEVRRRFVDSLSPSQQAAAEIATAALQEKPLKVVDGQVDSLDPWVRRGFLDYMRRSAAEGAAWVVASNLEVTASWFDWLIVLNPDHTVAFSGNLTALSGRSEPAHLTVQTHRQEGVRALVAPFAFEIVQKEGRLEFRASEGQETAAKLLAQGYGDVSLVTVRERTPAEMVLDLVRI